MTIYFAGSIRGGRQGLDRYREIISLLKRYGDVLTEHVGHVDPAELEKDKSDSDIYREDMAWLHRCDALVAEVTYPSLGVGYEIASAEGLGKKILCLFCPGAGYLLSSMIAGSPACNVESYREISEVSTILEDYFKDLSHIYS